MSKYLRFTESDKIADITAAMIDSPAAADVLTNPEYVEQQVIAPKYAFSGHIIANKYKKLRFCFLFTPIYVDYADFRLTDDNRYEFLGFDGKSVADFTTEDIRRAAEEMSENFDSIEEEPILLAYEGKTDLLYRNTVLNIVQPNWQQAHYRKDNYNGSKDSTDYSLPMFKDENGNTLKFVAQIYSGSVFGSYYLYYSAKTRLVRQFFQCT